MLVIKKSEVISQVPIKLQAYKPHKKKKKKKKKKKTQLSSVSKAVFFLMKRCTFIEFLFF